MFKPKENKKQNIKQISKQDIEKKHIFLNILLYPIIGIGI